MVEMPIWWEVKKFHALWCCLHVAYPSSCKVTWYHVVSHDICQSTSQYILFIYVGVFHLKSWSVTKAGAKDFPFIRQENIANMKLSLIVIIVIVLGSELNVIEARPDTCCRLGFKCCTGKSKSLSLIYFELRYFYLFFLYLSYFSNSIWLISLCLP